MAKTRVQIQNAGYVLGVDDVEVDNVVEPIVTPAIPMLRRDSQRILSPAEQTIKFEFYFEDVSRFKLSQVVIFQTCVRAEHVDAYAITNQNAGNRVQGTASEPAKDSNPHDVTGMEGATRFAVAVA